MHRGLIFKIKKKIKKLWFKRVSIYFLRKFIDFAWVIVHKTHTSDTHTYAKDKRKKLGVC